LTVLSEKIILIENIINIFSCHDFSKITDNRDSRRPFLWVAIVEHRGIL